MKFFLWLKGMHDGCDYTIGCNEKLIELKSDTPGRAVAEATEKIREYTDPERPLAQAMLLKPFEDLTKVCGEVLANKQYLERERERDKKRREIERLQRELDEGEDT